MTRFLEGPRRGVGTSETQRNEAAPKGTCIAKLSGRRENSPEERSPESSRATSCRAQGKPILSIDRAPGTGEKVLQAKLSCR